MISTIDIYYSALVCTKTEKKHVKFQYCCMYLCLLFMKNKACLQNASIISQKEEKLNEKGTIAVKYYDNNQPTMHFCPKVCGSPPHLF